MVAGATLTPPFATESCDDQRLLPLWHHFKLDAFQSAAMAALEKDPKRGSTASRT